MDDIARMLSAWEDVRTRRLLTEEQKKALRQSQSEHILLQNGNNEYELTACERLHTKDKNISAFRFERGGKQCAVVWHNTGTGELLLPVSTGKLQYSDTPDGVPIELAERDSKVFLPVSGRRYLATDLTEEELKKAFSE